MRFFFETDFEALAFLPFLTLLQPRCTDPACEADHGWALNVGWLFWMLVLHVPGHEEEGES